MEENNLFENSIMVFISTPIQVLFDEVLKIEV